MTALAQTDLSKEELIDAAVAVVEKEVAGSLEKWEQVLAGTLSTSNLHLNDYVSSYTVTWRLKDDDVIRAVPKQGDYYGKENAAKAVEAKVKRALDEEAAKPNARILRFSTRDGVLPRLDGQRRRLFGQQVAYTTPELYRKAQEAVLAAETTARDEAAEFKVLLGRARAAGLVDYDEPTYGVTSIIINLDQMRKLVPMLESHQEVGTA
jgi:hypothetical protein